MPFLTNVNYTIYNLNCCNCIHIPQYIVILKKISKKSCLSISFCDTMEIYTQDKGQ